MSNTYGTADDGTPLTWEVVMPAGKTKAPWILTIDSAHWVIDDGVLSSATSAITAAGYAAVHPKHRLAPEMGGECANKPLYTCGKIQGQVGNGMFPQENNDVEMAVAAAKRDPRCDGRVGAIGGSGGGYLASWLQAKGLVFAAVAFSPATQLVDMVNGGGQPADKAKNFCAAADYAAASPALLETAKSSPLYLAAFSTDQMPAGQYTAMVDALNAKGVIHTNVLVSGTGHSWGLWPSQQTAVMAFFKAHLGTPSPSPTVTPTASPTPTATPTTTTGAATNIGTTTFTANGTVVPRGASTTAVADWGATTSYGSTTSSIFVGNDDTSHPVAFNITGRTPNSLTHFRIRATNSGGTGIGADATVTTSPTPSPTPVRISATKIVGGGSATWGNTHARGRFKTYTLKDLQPTSATINLSDMNDQYALAVANGQDFVICLNLNSGDPAQGEAGLPLWLRTAGAHAYGIYNANNATTLYQFFPWDTVWQANAMTVIAAVCDEMDGKAVSIVMGGLGITSEMHMADVFPYPDPDNSTIGQAAAKWVTSSNALIAQYAAHLTRTTFTAALAVPFAGTTGTDALNSVVNNALALYGGRIGFENWGLNALSSYNFLPNKIISDHSATNPVGFQMTGSEVSGGGGNLCGQGGGAPTPPCLRAAMNAGVALNAQYLEIFGQDMAASQYFTDFDQVSLALHAPPF